MLDMAQIGRLEQGQTVAHARALLEAEGREGLTMRALARSLGVKAPSLYFHVESRDDLLREIAKAGLAELRTTLERAEATGGGVHERAKRLAAEYQAFAERNPELFRLLFESAGDERSGDAADVEAAVGPFTRLLVEQRGQAPMLGPTVWAFVHGYTVLKLARQFEALVGTDGGPGLDIGLDAILGGWSVEGGRDARL
jgi:AcrR family transcriptional regulator